MSKEKLYSEKDVSDAFMEMFSCIVHDMNDAISSLSELEPRTVSEADVLSRASLLRFLEEQREEPSDLCFTTEFERVYMNAWNKCLDTVRRFALSDSQRYCRAERCCMEEKLLP